MSVIGFSKYNIFRLKCIGNVYICLTDNHVAMMKKILVATILTLALSFCAKGQLVYSCQYKTEADVKVYVTKYKTEADLIVYKCKYRTEAEGNKGLWYFVKYRTEAKKKIYFVDYKTEANLVIYFSDYRTEAEWRNKSKQHLMY